MKPNNLSLALWLLAGMAVWAGSADRAEADPPALHGFYEITRHVHVEDSCGEEPDSNVDEYSHFHLEGNTVGHGFDFDRYFLTYCTSTDTDQCENADRYSRFFEVQAEDRAIEQGVVVEMTGRESSGRRGGACRISWSRSVYERTAEGMRIRFLNEAVELNESEYDGPCEASEKTAHLLEGNCDEARVIEGTHMADQPDRHSSTPEATESTSDDGRSTKGDRDTDEDILAKFGRSDDEDDSKAKGVAYSGHVADFDGEDMEIRINHSFDELGTGQISKDGSFSFQLHPLSESLDNPSRILRSISNFMRCEINEEDFSDTDFQWRTVNSYIRTGVEIYPTFREEEGAMLERFGVLRLADYFDGEHADVGFPRKNVFWVYVDRDVEINADNCGNGSFFGRRSDTVISLDLDLQAGWNEVVVTYVGHPGETDVDEFRHETTSRPDSVKWQIRDDIH